MRREVDERYASAGDGKCWEMYHPGLGPHSPYCDKSVDHEGDHQGNGLRWTEEPQVDTETVKRYLEAYRRIPNSNHEIVLNDDATVTMTLRGFEAAVMFLGVRPTSD